MAQIVSFSGPLMNGAQVSVWLATEANVGCL